MASHRRPGRFRHADPARRRTTALVAAVASAALAGTVASGAMVLHASAAAFTGSTSNGPQTYTAGTVVLTDDGVGTLFSSISNLKPGDTATSCIKVTYTGTLGAAVKLFAATANDTGLGAYVKFTVDQGTTGPAASRTCGTAPAFGGTITPLTSATVATSLPTSYGTGYTCWTAATNDNRWYRITYLLDAATPDAQQGKKVDVTLTWQAQNT